MILYCVIPESQITNAMLNLCIGSSKSKMRTSRNRANRIFKFNSKDDLARQVFKDYLWRDRKEILKILNTGDDW